MKYRYLEHTADVLFEAYGKDLPELFANAALATEEIMVELKTLKKSQDPVEINLIGKDAEELLFNFLEELIFLKDTKQYLFKEFNIKIKKIKKEYKLSAKCMGEKINPKKQELGRDVKAVTLHEFEVKKEKEGWKAKVLLDV